MAPLNICELCRRRGTKDNEINRHHVRGKRHPEVMYTHSKTCHVFAQWVTNLYLLKGRENELDSRRIIYLFNRVTTLRHGDGFVLPFYR